MDVIYNLIGKDNVTAAAKSAADALENLRDQWGKIGIALGAGAVTAFGGLAVVVRQSIEAADAMGDLATASGVSVEWLSRMQLAAETSGISNETFAKRIQKLSVQMAEANRGTGEAAQRFAALGVSVTDSAGKLRPAEEVFMDLAEAFPNIASEAERTELAMKLFGKGGADMVPLLMQGRDGIVELQRVADKLGISLSGETASAAGRVQDAFDILGKTGKGMANELMTRLLPTIEGVVKAFWDWRMAGNGSSLMIDTVVGGIKILVSAFFFVQSIIDAASAALSRGAEAVMDFIKAIIEAASALMSRFSEAAIEFAKGNLWNSIEAVRRGFREAGKPLGDLSMFSMDSVRRSLTEVADPLVNLRSKLDALWSDSLPKFAKAAEAPKKPLENLSKAVAEVSKEGEKFAKQIEDLIKKTTEYVEKQQLQIDGGKELSESQRMLLEIGKFLRDNLHNLTEAEVDYWREQIRRIDANETTLRLTRDLAKAEDDYAKVLGKAVDSIDKGTASLAGKNAKLADEIEALSMSKDEHALLIAQRRADELAALDQLLALKVLAGEGYDPEYQALVRRRTEMANNIELEGKLADKTRATQAMAAWAATFQNLGQSLSDWIMQGGKNAADYLRGLFRQLILTPTLRWVMTGMVGGLASLLGIGNASAAGPGGAQGSGMLNVLASLGSSTFGLGLSGSIAGFTAGGAFSLAGGLANMGTSVMSLLGAGSYMGALGAAMPGLAPLLALAALFSRRRSSPARQTFGIADAMGNQGPNFWSRETSNPSGESYFDIVRSLSGSVGGSAAYLGGRINPNLLFGLYSSESPDGKGAQSVGRVFDWVTGRQLLNVDENGSNESLQGRLESYLPRMLLAGLQGSDLPQRFAEYFAQFNPATMAVEEINAALERANLARGVQLLLAPLFDLGDASVDALARVAELSGGIEALARNAQGFVSNYYSESEQQSMAAAQLVAQLRAVGIDPDTLRSAGDFRSLVESLSSNLDSGNNAERFAALLGMQGQFAELARLLTETRDDAGNVTRRARTLQDLIDMNPGLLTNALLGIGDGTGGAASPAVRAADGTTSAVRALTQAYTDGVGQMRGDLADLAARVERAVSAIQTVVEVRVTKTDDTNVAVLPA